jgi:beta-phosphoglucomutase-like phosphatase (HAD superfamily)
MRAVIFDLDGVLADSEPLWSEIDAKLLAEYGVTYRGEYHQNVVGVSYRLAVEFYKKAFGLSVLTGEMMRRRGEIATEFFANRVGLFASVKEVLEELRQMKLHLAVATSSVSQSARPFLDRHQLTKFSRSLLLVKKLNTANPLPTSINARRANLEFPATHAL